MSGHVPIAHARTHSCRLTERHDPVTNIPFPLSGVTLCAAVLALASCAGPDSPTPVKNLRQDGAPISSAALFDPAAFAGQWQVIASNTQGCAGAQQYWTQTTPLEYLLSGQDCSNGTAATALQGTATVTGPGGRITTSSAYGQAPVWVLWVDQDYRVAALGTPSGQFGQIIARPQAASRQDLLAAAKEVMAFNGYPSDSLKP